MLYQFTCYYLLVTISKIMGCSYTVRLSTNIVFFMYKKRAKLYKKFRKPTALQAVCSFLEEKLALPDVSCVSMITHCSDLCRCNIISKDSENGLQIYVLCT
jgi:hypothetical protein